MKNYLLVVFLGLVCAGCNRGERHYKDVNKLRNIFGNEVCNRFHEPEGYKSIWHEDTTFGKYLITLNLKPHGSVVHYYNGKTKPNKNTYAAVVNLPIGNKDLMQCADVIMYLWADYLYRHGRFSEIHFNFTNGFNAEYTRWQEGYRIKVNGDDVSWTKTDTFNADRPTFLEFMNVVYAYAGTMSLEKQMQKVPYWDLRSGDVLIQPGSPGHAVIVVDVAYNEDKKIMYMLAQGFMPAQEMQILENPGNPGISPWYELDPAAKEIKTPEWTFSTEDLRRFANN